MPVCYLDDEPHEITLTETVMSRAWLDRFAGETLHRDRPYNTTIMDRLYQLISTHRPLFAKLRLEFLTDVTARTDLMHQPRLRDIHAGMVDLQKRHTGTTDLLGRNTQGGWEEIHEHIHDLESQLRRGSMTFMRTPGLKHDTHDSAPGWLWQNQFTAEQWAASTTFTTADLTIPTMELGRTPYEAFLYAPDRWHTEGSIAGTLAPRAVLSTTRSHHRPDEGYEQWCEAQGIPVIGDQLPLANFKDHSYLAQMPTVKKIRIQR
jgi:hypothetical protein